MASDLMIAGREKEHHALFAEVLRLRLRCEHPDRVAPLHRRAARWYERNGQLADAVRHAAQAGDWQLAASIVIDALAIGEIIETRGSPSLVGEFAGMPPGRAWTEPQPHLVSAAAALSAGQHGWPAVRQRPARPASTGCLPETPARRRLSPVPGCTWVAMSCARRVRTSARPTRPWT